MKKDQRLLFDKRESTLIGYSLMLARLKSDLKRLSNPEVLLRFFKTGEYIFRVKEFNNLLNLKIWYNT